jgi:hypothetical protein
MEGHGPSRAYIGDLSAEAEAVGAELGGQP